MIKLAPDCFILVDFVIGCQVSVVGCDLVILTVYHLSLLRVLNSVCPATIKSQNESSLQPNAAANEDGKQ